MLLLYLSFYQWAYTQSNNFQLPISINHNGAAPDASAILDVQSYNKGVLTPRMTQAQRDAITSPATGLLIYQTNNTPGFYTYDGSVWKEVVDDVMELPSSGNNGNILQTDGIGTYTWVTDQVDDADADATNEIEIPSGGTITSTTRDDALYTAKGFSYIGKTSLDVETAASPEGWTATTTSGVPLARVEHTAIWTGTKMIVWGGITGGSTNTGGQYDPINDTWAATSTSGAPIARNIHTAIWTGREMIVWGGVGSSGYQNTGGKYDPSTDTWTATDISDPDLPSAREKHTAIWTGTEMIIWGGSTSVLLNTGGKYNPGTDSWTATTTSGAPSARVYHTAIWTGTEMIVWGGYASGGSTNTGGKYDPTNDTWIATSTTGTPSARSQHTGIWTGTQMIVWGGADGSYVNTGGKYDPVNDAWTATAIPGAPSGREGQTAIWTGAEMIVWGGYDGSFANTGGKYNTALDSWVATEISGAPSARIWHTGIWTGTEMIVWGGYNGVRLNTGGIYSPGPSVMSTVYYLYTKN